VPLRPSRSRRAERSGSRKKHRPPVGHVGEIDPCVRAHKACRVSVTPSLPGAADANSLGLGQETFGLRIRSIDPDCPALSLDTIFWVTTTTSPSARGACSAMSAARSSPRADLAQALDAQHQQVILRPPFAQSLPEGRAALSTGAPVPRARRRPQVHARQSRARCARGLRPSPVSSMTVGATMHFTPAASTSPATSASASSITSVPTQRLRKRATPGADACPASSDKERWSCPGPSKAASRHNRRHGHHRSRRAVNTLVTPATARIGLSTRPGSRRHDDDLGGLSAASTPGAGLEPPPPQAHRIHHDRCAVSRKTPGSHLLRSLEPQPCRTGSSLIGAGGL